MLMYGYFNAVEPTHVACICTVQFVWPFQSASSGLKLLLCGDGFGP